MIGSTVHHYEILEQLGSGGMGVVYKARDTKLNRHVALKFLPSGMGQDAEANARFIQEAQAASALDHPNICTIHEIGEADDGRLFIAMAYYEGQTIKYRLDDGPMEAEIAEGITNQLLEGLHAAHEKGIVHRDIKPANIMVTDDGRVKILDFGLAKLSGGLELTKSHSTVGTAYYMSPEQIRGEEVDPRTDLWSVGVVLYQMLTGRRPFEGEYEQAIGYAILNESPPDLPEDVPPVLTGMVSSLLKKDRTERPGSAIDALGLSDGGTSDKTPTQPSGTRWSKKAVAGMGAAVITVVLVVTAVLSPRGPTTETVASSDVDPVPTIAVLPFDVSGNEDLAYLREGMVRLLSNKLDGLSDLAAADANSILSFVDRQDGRVDVEVGKEAARHMNATGFILGSVITAGNVIRMSASLYGTDGTKQTTQEWSVRSDSLLIPAIDSMAIGLLADRLNLEGREIASVAALTSNSFEALGHYLKGERLLRLGRDQDAQIEEFRRAVEIDSTFSLAWFGLRRAAGWGNRYIALTGPASRAASRHSASLPAKIGVPMTAWFLFDEDRWQKAERLIRPYLQLHPQEPEAWYVLGEIVYHNYGRIGRSPHEAQTYFEKAAAIDPSNSEYRSHISSLLFSQQRFGDLLEYYEQLLRDSMYSWTDIPVAQKALELLVADSSVRTPERVALEQGSLDNPIAKYLVYFSIMGRRPEMARLAASSLDTEDVGGWIDLQNYRLASGQFDEAMRQSPLREEHIIALWIPRILPFKSFPKEELERMRRLVADWDTTSNPLSMNWSPISREGSHEIWYPYRYDEFKAFVVGGLSLALGDHSGLEYATNSLWDPPSSPYDSTFAKSLHNLLQAMEALRTNDLDTAIDHINVTSFRRAPETGRFPYYSEKLVRWIRAEILLAKGDYEAARNWYRILQVDPVNFAWPGFIAPSIYREAVCDEALADYEAALAHYRMFIEYWQDADEDLQPMVDEARAGIERVQAAMVREPAG